MKLTNRPFWKPGANLTRTWLTIFSSKTNMNRLTHEKFPLLSLNRQHADLCRGLGSGWAETISKWSVYRYPVYSRYTNNFHFYFVQHKKIRPYSCKVLRSRDLNMGRQRRPHRWSNQVRSNWKVIRYELDYTSAKFENFITIIILFPSTSW